MPSTPRRRRERGRSFRLRTFLGKKEKKGNRRRRRYATSRYATSRRREPHRDPRRHKPFREDHRRLGTPVSEESRRDRSSPHRERLRGPGPWQSLGRDHTAGGGGKDGEGQDSGHPHARRTRNRPGRRRGRPRRLCSQFSGTLSPGALDPCLGGTELARMEFEGERRSNDGSERGAATKNTTNRPATSRLSTGPPPLSIRAAVLGSILFETITRGGLAQIVHPKDFSDPTFAKVWTAVRTSSPATHTRCPPHRRTRSFHRGSGQLGATPKERTSPTRSARRPHESGLRTRETVMLFKAGAENLIHGKKSPARPWRDHNRTDNASTFP